MSRDHIADFFANLGTENDPVGKTYPGSRHDRRAPIEYAPINDSWEELGQWKMVCGRRMELFPIGAIASVLNRTPITIRRWTRQGYLPHAPYRLPGYTRPDGKYIAGRRYYTRAMVESIAELFRQRGLLETERVEWKFHMDLPELIQKTWTALYEEDTTSSEGKTDASTPTARH